MAFATAHFRQDFLRGGGPLERHRVPVPVVDVGRDRVGQLLHAVHGEPLELALRQLREEALDEVEPRGRRGDEVELHPGVLLQPRLHPPVLVRRVVVEDDVKIELRIDPLLHLGHEAEELPVPVAGHALVDHLPGRHVQRREQGPRPVALVVVRHCAALALLPRKPRLRAVQRLDPALLVEGEHDRPLRRVHVQPHHVPELLHELRIGRELEGPREVRLQPVRPPDPRHLAVVEPRRLRHQPRAPVRPPRGILLQRPAHDLRLHLRGDARSRTAPARPVLQSGETLGLVPVQPPLDGRKRDAHLPAQSPGREAIGRAEDDPGALDAPLRGRAGPNPALELLAVPGSQPDPSYLGHAWKNSMPTTACTLRFSDTTLAVSASPPHRTST